VIISILLASIQIASWFSDEVFRELSALGLLGVTFTCGILWNKIATLDKKVEDHLTFSNHCYEDRLTHEKVVAESLAEVKVEIRAIKEVCEELRQSIRDLASATRGKFSSKTD
jgi:hypothetical protein